MINFALIHKIREHFRSGTLHTGNTDMKGREIELCEIILELLERK